MYMYLIHSATLLSVCVAPWLSAGYQSASDPHRTTQLLVAKGVGGGGEEDVPAESTQCHSTLTVSGEPEQSQSRPAPLRQQLVNHT